MNAPRILLAAALFAVVSEASAQAVVPGYLTDPTAVREALGGDGSYRPPERLKYPYVSTYYVKPTVTTEEDVKVGIFVTDFESSKIRFLDDSHRFSAFLEYRPVGGESTMLTLEDLPSGDAEFDLGRLPAGDYELRAWAKDAQGRESHRVIHDFRVRAAADLGIPADKVYAMAEADLEAYGIRNDGDLERVVHVATNGARKVVKEKRAGVPGYTVTVPLDPKTGEVPYRAFEKATVAYDEGYDKDLVETNAVRTAEGLQRLLDEKAAAGFRKVVLLPGVYRVSHAVTLFLPDDFTLDLGGATLKLNAFTGAKSAQVRLASAVDAHLANGTIEGDYWTHDYAGSPNGSEWILGFEIGGAARYCSVENVRIAEVTGYGGQNSVSADKRGGIEFFYESLPRFAPGGLDPATGEVDASDSFRFTTDFKDLAPVTGKAGRRRLQVSRYLGYQGCATRSWQMTVAWYDAQRRFLAAETAWQYREMWIPEGAAFLRVSVEAESAEAADEAGLKVTALRHPVNCAVLNCRFERCRGVGYAAAAMKNMLFEGNLFTTSGEALAKCAFDAEDGWDQMQDVTFRGNVFRDNPVNNSILACAGHNFVLERNDGGIFFWGRTHSPCVRDNDVGDAYVFCDSRIRSGYGRFEGNRVSKGVVFGKNDMPSRPDGWDFVLSGKTFDGAAGDFRLEVGKAGRVVGCAFRNMGRLGIANAYACTFENCKGWLPNARWVEVEAKDSAFKNFHGTNAWERCRFRDTRFESVARSVLSAKDCEFAGGGVFGFNASTVGMTDCTFSSATVEGGWWEHPANLLFKGCRIATRADSAFLRTGVYTIGRFDFDGCTVSGARPLVDVKDLRVLPVGNPAEGPDAKPGILSFKDVAWTGEAKAVVTHGAPPRDASQKRIALVDAGNDWPEGVDLAPDPLPTWERK